MMISPYIDAMADGSLDVPLFDLKIHRNEELVAKGNGRLMSSQKRSIVIEAYVRGTDNYRKQLERAKDSKTAGKIVGPDRHYSVSALTRNQERLTAKFHHPTPLFGDFQKWVIDATHIEIARGDAPARDEPQDGAVGLVDRLPKVYPLESTWVERKRQRDGREVVVGGDARRDWWATEVDGVHYHFEQREGGPGLLKCYPKRGRGRMDVCFWRLCSAISFISGSPVRIFGYYLCWDHAEKYQSRIVLRPNSMLKARSPVADPVPLNAYREHRLIDWCDAINCFLIHLAHNEDSPLIRSVFSYLDSAKNYFSIQALILTTTIEGLSKYIVEKSRVSALRIEEGDDEFLLLKERCLKLLSDSPDVANDPAFNRIQGLFGMATSLGSWRVIVEAGRLLGFNVTRKDTDAWGKLRHRGAHGGPLGGINQKKLNRYHRCVALLYKLILGLIGYRGRYVDYTARDVVQFPYLPLHGENSDGEPMEAQICWRLFPDLELPASDLVTLTQSSKGKVGKALRFERAEGKIEMLPGRPPRYRLTDAGRELYRSIRLGEDVTPAAN